MDSSKDDDDVHGYGYGRQRSHDASKALVKALDGKSVSKLWKSLIDSSEFIKSYHSCKTHLFVLYEIANEVKYVSIVDDDTFPNTNSLLTVPQLRFCLLGWKNIDDTNSSAIEVYEPSSGHINGIGFYGASDSFSMNSYMVNAYTLLDQSNSSFLLNEG
ncbi:hypothetical protein Tco_0477937 [Tanacetum coccineum]